MTNKKPKADDDNVSDELIRTFRDHVQALFFYKSLPGGRFGFRDTLEDDCSKEAEGADRGDSQ